jgi:hypothetical protein
MDYLKDLTGSAKLPQRKDDIWFKTINIKVVSENIDQ